MKKNDLTLHHNFPLEELYYLPQAIKNSLLLFYWFTQYFKSPGNNLHQNAKPYK